MADQLIPNPRKAPTEGKPYVELVALVDVEVMNAPHSLARDK